MARKRGGLAGLWDRNKAVIKPIATIGAGLINPALGAAVGAAMGGLDRPGQRGVGLNVGGALKGGASGYAMGKLGALGGAKLGAARAMPGAASSVAGAPVTQFPTAGLKALGSAGGGFLKDPRNLQTLVSGVATGAGILDARQQNKLATQRMGLDERQVALAEQRQRADEDLLAKRRAAVEQLLPFLMQGLNGGGLPRTGA